MSIAVRIETQSGGQVSDREFDDTLELCLRDIDEAKCTLEWYCDSNFRNEQLDILRRLLATGTHLKIISPEKADKIRQDYLAVTEDDGRENIAKLAHRKSSRGLSAKAPPHKIIAEIVSPRWNRTRDKSRHPVPDEETIQRLTQRPRALRTLDILPPPHPGNTFVQCQQAKRHICKPVPDAETVLRLTARPKQWRSLAAPPPHHRCKASL